MSLHFRTSRTARTFVSSIAVATVASLALAMPAAADTPSATTDVATLRQLLALQYPALKQGAATIAPAEPPVAVTVEPEHEGRKRADDRGA